MSEAKELDLAKIVDFAQILKNTYTMVVDNGGVHLTVPEILLAVNTFHALVVRSIAQGSDDRPAMTPEEVEDLFRKAISLFTQELMQEAA